MNQVSPSPASPAAVCRGWGAFFYPPIFVGTPLDQEALSRHNSGYRAFVKALDTTYKGRPVIVSRMGLVVLAEAQRDTALGLLNEVMAAILFRSVPVCGVREADLVECSIDMAEKEIAGGKWSYETGNRALLKEGCDFSGWNARFYHPDNIRGFMRRAEAMNSHTTVRMDLRLLLEAYTHHQELSFATSFLMSWSGIVRLLQARWRRLSQQRPGEDGAHSPSSGFGGDICRVIDELHSCNAIDPSVYQTVKKLNEMQNNIINSGHEPTMDESSSCFHFFLSQLRKALTSEQPERLKL